MLPEALSTTRELLYRTRDWRGPTASGDDRLAERPPSPAPVRSEFDAFAVEWQVATSGDGKP